MKQLTMTHERYTNICQMLNSSDVENHTIGLSILEEQPFKENAAFILLIKKEAPVSNKLWETHAPQLYKELKDIRNLDVEKVLTYKSILQALVEIKAPIDQIQFYLETFSKYLHKQIIAIGYDFIEDLELKIKLKEKHEQSGELSESK